MHVESKKQVAAGFALVVLGVALLTGFAASPAAASDGSGFFDPVLADDSEDDGWIGSLTSGLGGLSDRIAYGAKSMVYGPEHSASEVADGVQTEFNSHSDAYQRYANNRVTATTDHDVVELTVKLDGEEATRYLVADVSTSSEYENASIVESTDRAVDDEIKLSGYAADNAEDELTRFREDFVEPGENVTSSYKADMASRYAGHVEQDLVGGDGE